jgi:hypothetical protein
LPGVDDLIPLIFFVITVKLLLAGEAEATPDWINRLNKLPPLLALLADEEIYSDDLLFEFVLDGLVA